MRPAGRALPLPAWPTAPRSVRPCKSSDGLGKRRATPVGAVTPPEAPTCRQYLQAGKTRHSRESVSSLSEFSQQETGLLWKKLDAAHAVASWVRGNTPAWSSSAPAVGQ